MSQPISPPALAIRMLRRTLPADVRDSIEGDLRELFTQRVASRSGRAQLWYWREALSLSVHFAIHDRRTRAKHLTEAATLDVRHALRSLRKSLGFTTACVLTLSLGICACTTIFSAVDAVLLRSLPFPDLDRLVSVAALSQRCPDCDNATPGHYLALRDHAKSFASLAGYGSWSGVLQGRERAEHVNGAKVTANLFSTLGVKPSIGRTFTADSVSPPVTHEVVLSEALWRTHFGADSSVVGSMITLSGERYTVVGVMPPAFEFPAAGGVWLPLAFTAADANDLNGHWLRIIGRLARGVTMAQAQGELDAFGSSLATTYADQAKGWRLVSQSLSDALLRQLWQFFSLLMAGALFVLLIVCANVANLLLARNSARQRELAVRSALGAGRWRVVQQLLAETTALTLLGALAGAMLAGWTVPLLKRSIPPSMTRFVPGWNLLALDTRALGFAIALSFVCALVAGVCPALRASRADLTASLREGGHGATAWRGARTRRALVTAEFALALVLIMSAGLMVQSVRNLIETNTGMRTEDVLTMSLELPDARYGSATQVAGFYKALQSTIVALPGVQRAAAITTLPLSHDRNFTRFKVSGRPPVPTGQGPTAVSEFVTPGYFATLGINLVSGRDFTVRDDSGAPPVAVISAKMAERYWPNDDAVGRGLELAGTRYQIIGVAADVRDQMEAPAAITIYQSALQTGSRGATLVIRAACSLESSHCDATSLIAAARAAIASIDRGVAVSNTRTMQRVVFEYVAPWRLLMALLAIFAIFALIIAAVGIYGVMMSAVLQRTHEIGIRMALGADRNEVVRMIVGDAARLIGWGTVFGIVGALATSRVLPFLLYRVSANDPTVLGSVALLLALVGLMASWLPARRATGVDPTHALRYD
jgi:putative ABC transport system permease protein